MKIEGYGSDTFTACKRLYDSYRYTVADNQAYASLHRKYAGTTNIPFSWTDGHTAAQTSQWARRDDNFRPIWLTDKCSIHHTLLRKVHSPSVMTYHVGCLRGRHSACRRQRGAIIRAYRRAIDLVKKPKANIMYIRQGQPREQAKHLPASTHFSLRNVRDGTDRLTGDDFQSLPSCCPIYWSALYSWHLCIL